MFELELPVGERMAKKPAPVDLETAIELCRQYREWFGLAGRATKPRLEEPCRAEFFL